MPIYRFQNTLRLTYKVNHDIEAESFEQAFIKVMDINSHDSHDFAEFHNVEIAVDSPHDCNDSRNLELVEAITTTPRFISQPTPTKENR